MYVWTWAKVPRLTFIGPCAIVMAPLTIFEHSSWISASIIRFVTIVLVHVTHLSQYSGCTWWLPPKFFLPQSGLGPTKSEADRPEDDRGVRECSAVYHDLSLCRVVLPSECTSTLDCIIIMLVYTNTSSAETLSGWNPWTTRCSYTSLSTSTLGVRLSRCAWT